MFNPIPPFAKRSLATLKAISTAIRATAIRLWRLHLETIRQSPTYEIAILALIDLILGHRVDLHDFLIRLMTRLRRNPPEHDPDTWAY